MITATFTTDEESGSIILRLTGHAGAGKKGSDLVCAAASMLAYTVAQTLQYMYVEGGLQQKPHIKLSEGDTLIVAKPKPESFNEALHTFFVVQVGYHLLANSYPENIELISFGKPESEEGEG